MSINLEKMLITDVFEFLLLSDRLSKTQRFFIYHHKQQRTDPYIKEDGTSICLIVLLCAALPVNTYRLRVECSTDKQLEQNHVWCSYKCLCYKHNNKQRQTRSALFWKLTGCSDIGLVSDFLSHSIGSVLNLAELTCRALASGKDRSLAYLQWKGPDCQSCYGVDT